MQSVPITSNVVSSNSARANGTGYNIMWKSVSATCFVVVNSHIFNCSFVFSIFYLAVWFQDIFLIFIEFLCTLSWLIKQPRVTAWPSNSKTKIHSYNAEMHIRFTGEVSIEITRINQNVMGGCRGRDRMVVGFTLIYAISDYHL